MGKFLKRLKLELFFIRRLLQEGYLLNLFSYIKNRFFGNILAKGVAKYDRGLGDENFEVHVLTQKDALWMLIWVLRSFLHYSGLCPKIIIHDEGSFDDETAKLLEDKFSNLKVLRRKDADALIWSRSDLTENFKKFRGYPNNIVLKFTDIFLLSKARKIFVLDNDILFFKKPQEIIDFVEGRLSYDGIVVPQDGVLDLGITEEYDKKHHLREHKVDYINSGIMLYNKDKLTPEMFWEYFDNLTLKPDSYFVEWAGWVSLFGQINCKVLPAEKYILKGKINDETVTKHFTSGRRYELYAYAIDRVIKSMNQ